ncbi:hypothetical protein ACIRD6_07605 [Streptomyces sp. NPDC102473]|uniref:hypothetical protein n=1 Tax=Streptomyces sp. NPDC102473 TaxID=3366180 RepID=UPI0038229984
MDQRSSLDPAPCWVPASGHALRHVGVHFDAVRLIGLAGDQVAYELMQFTGFRAGPVVRSRVGDLSTYFLLPPQSAAAHRWPAGARLIGRDLRCDAFVGIPALEGRTWPLDWRSRPTGEAPFVDAKLLYEVAVEVLAGPVGP